MSHGTSIDNYSRRIHATGKTFSDPKCVKSLITLLVNPYLSASDLNPVFQEDLSSTTKRLSRLEQMGFIQSRRIGSRRLYWVNRRERTVNLLNSIMRFRS